MNDQVDKKQFEQDFKKRKLKGIKMLSQKANDVLYEVHLGETVVKQNQFDILLAEINKINNKVDVMNSDFNKKIDVMNCDFNKKIDVMNSDFNKKIDVMNSDFNKKIDGINNKVDEGFKKVNSRLDVIESDVSELKKDMSEVKTILKKHDDAMVEHGWFNKSNMN